MFREQEDQLAFATAGVNRLRIDPSGKLLVGDVASEDVDQAATVTVQGSVRIMRYYHTHLRSITMEDESNLDLFKIACQENCAGIAIDVLAIHVRKLVNDQRQRGDFDLAEIMRVGATLKMYEKLACDILLELAGIRENDTLRFLLSVFDTWRRDAPNACQAPGPFVTGNAVIISCKTRNRWVLSVLLHFRFRFIIDDLMEREINPLYLACANGDIDMVEKTSCAFPMYTHFS